MSITDKQHTWQVNFALGHDPCHLLPYPCGAYDVGGACAWTGARRAPSCHPHPLTRGVTGGLQSGPRPLACTACCLGPSLSLLPTCACRDTDAVVW